MKPSRFELLMVKGPRMTRNFLWVLLLSNVMLALPACVGLMYSTEPIEAHVVDVETKLPLESVIVVAHWELEQGSLGGSVTVGQLMVMETLTDKQGRFAFPAFGPKLAVTSHLVHKDPELILFKNGYYYRALTNEYSSDPELRIRAVRHSDWHGKTIELKPFNGTTEEYAQHLLFLHTSIRSIIVPGIVSGNCEWKKIPLLMVAAHKQALFFHAEHVQSSLYRIQALPNGDKCGSPEEFFKEYLP